MSHHTLVHRLVQPPVRLLARAGVTPNQLTGLRLATGLAGALALGQGRPAWTALGAGGFLLSMLLDRADGQLARFTGRTSASGYRYDLLADGASTVAVFIGMGFGAQARWGAASILMGAVAAVCVVALFYLTQALEPGGEVSRRRPFDPDDALLLAPFMIWAGLMPWALLLAAVISPAVVVILAALLFARRGLQPLERG